MKKQYKKSSYIWHFTIDISNKNKTKYIIYEIRETTDKKRVVVRYIATKRYDGLYERKYINIATKNELIKAIFFYTQYTKNDIDYVRQLLKLSESKFLKIQRIVTEATKNKSNSPQTTHISRLSNL